MKFKSVTILYNYLKVPLDAILFAVAFALAFIFRYDIPIPADQIELLKIWILPVVLIKLAIFYFMRIYRRLWRYASVKDFFLITLANIIGSITIGILIYLVFRSSITPSILVIDDLIALTFTTGIRFTVRGLSEFTPRKFWNTATKPLLIAGAGYTGSAIIKEMLSRPALAYQPVGIIDDDKSKQGLQVHGVKVLGTRKELPKLLRDYSIEEVIICMPNVSRDVIRDIFFQCQKAGVKCRTMPGIYRIIDGSVRIDEIKEVDVEDILGREPVKVDMKRLSTYIADKPVMVIGAGGSIGAELCRQLYHMHPSALILLDQSESALYEIEQELAHMKPAFLVSIVIADITKRNRIESIFFKYSPAIVFHTAAYKHVPLMESNVIEAVENNIFGTKLLCELSIKAGVERFIFISTDKAVEPVNMMGLSKAICEMVVQCFSDEYRTRFMSVRFGNVLDSSGSVVPIFRRQIAQGGPLTVTDPAMIRFFMTIPEAVQLVIQAGAFGGNGEIFVLDMGEQVPIVELARNMIRLSGLEPEKDIPIEFTGIRPGERLFEKLTWDHEQTASTEHEKILMIKNTNLNKVKFMADIMELQNSVDTCDEIRLKELLRCISADHLHYDLP